MTLLFYNAVKEIKSKKGRPISFYYYVKNSFFNGAQFHLALRRVHHSLQAIPKKRAFPIR